MIAWADNQPVFTIGGNSINTSVSLSNGNHYVVVQAWDIYGNVYTAGGYYIGVSGNNDNPTYQMIQAMQGWRSCGSCAGRNGQGPDTPHSMTQWEPTPSLTGQAIEYWIGPAQAYSGALWWKQLGSNEGATHFVYDMYFYVKNPGAAQSLEFDMNQSAGQRKFIFGTQCDIQYTHQWNIWDTANAQWVLTGIPCSAPQAYTWNHLTLEFVRNQYQTAFVSVTLNGNKSYINRTFDTFGVNASELNTAVQLDGDVYATAYSLWVDQMSVTAW